VKHRREGSPGFSLFEVVLAAGILSLVMLGVLAAMNGSFLADRVAANATRSQSIARQTMEEWTPMEEEGEPPMKADGRGWKANGKRNEIPRSLRPSPFDLGAQSSAVSSSAGGQTLIETLIACFLMVIVYGAGLSLSVETRDAWSHLYHDTGALQAGREALHLIAADLAESGAGHVTITPSASYDALAFQTPVALNGETITWGADGVEGRWIYVHVVNGSLQREVVATSMSVGVVYDSRLLARNVDSLYEGQKGLAVTRVGNLCTIRLRVRAEQEGRVWRQQVNTGVLLRN
jgi:Tfp pilus assembly protein PilV